MTNDKKINPAAKLAAQLFDPASLASAATRDGYGEGVVLAGKKDKKVMVFCADVAGSTRSDLFRDKIPERYVELGVSEQSLVAIAAGAALAGKIPFVAAYAMFCPGRAWEQVRTNLCLNDANVKIAASHSGLAVGPDGASHQALEDIAITRVIPRLTVIAPVDAVEAQKAVLAAAAMVGPVYLRLSREKSPVFTTAATPFAIGRAISFRKGRDVTIIGCGPVLWNALLAARELSREGIECEVINSPSIKPLDKKTILAAAARTGAVVTLEDHQIAGGLGSTVAELLASSQPTPIEFVGVKDVFGESGEAAELWEKYGLGVRDVKKAVKRVLKRKH